MHIFVFFNCKVLFLSMQTFPSRSSKMGCPLLKSCIKTVYEIRFMLYDLFFSTSLFFQLQSSVSFYTVFSVAIFKNGLSSFRELFKNGVVVLFHVIWLIFSIVFNYFFQVLNKIKLNIKLICYYYIMFKIFVDV